MIDFLNDFGIGEYTIKELEQKYDENILYNLKINELEIEKIIRYFKEIGINNIDGILIYKTDLFYKTFKDIKKYFISNNNIVDLINSINEDVENIELLFN